MAMGRLDHYQVLMLDREVDRDLMTTVYRRLVQRYLEAATDDPAATDRLAAVERAYGVLRDPFSRRRYDAQLEREGGAPSEDPAWPAPVPAAVAASPAMTASATRTVVPVSGLAARLDPNRTRTVAPVAVPVVPSRPATARPVPVAILDFGRYAGWSLRQIAHHDPDYLQWLLRSPTGRQYRSQIEAILRPR